MTTGPKDSAGQGRRSLVAASHGGRHGEKHKIDTPAPKKRRDGGVMKAAENCNPPAHQRGHEPKGTQMQSGAEKLRALLFEGGRELVNFKFLPGTKKGLTSDEMQGEAARVIGAAIDGGLVHNPPFTGLAKRTI